MDAMMPQASLQPNPGLPVISHDMAEITERLGSLAHRFAGKTILITGASGVLPGYLADTIAYLNLHVLRSPARLLLLARAAPAPLSRLAHLVGRPDIQFLIQDARDPLAIDEPIHFIAHAASPATPQRFREDPVGAVEANSAALRQLLDLARRSDIESFLYFSSSEIYGTPEPEHIPTPETYLGRFDFTASRSFYAAAKRFGETLCAAYTTQYGLPVKVVRPFHVHGPGLRMDDGRIIAEMIMLGLDGKALELQSDGSATRTYGYVSDATLGFLQVLLSDYNGEAFNIGADAPETSIRELATTISRLLTIHDPVKVGPTPPDAGSPGRACPDLSKVRSLVGYAPMVSLETGLARTIAWLRAQRSAISGSSSS
jgi:dTDP-glucose 4,6-dehydratase/UDP-glucuronate decarboxylase